MNNRRLLIGGLLPALVFAAIVAGLASACSGEAEEGPAAAGLQAASPTIPFETPPAWDCVGTPPPGFDVDYGQPGGGCFLVPTNPCGSVSISGREVCVPAGSSIALDAGEPLGGVATLTLEFEGSAVAWKAFSTKDGRRDELVVWSVLPEHEDEFADLRAAFEAAGQDVP